MASFSERLKELRTSKGYSLQDLADRCNISKSAINLYERGERHPKHEGLVAIANVFNVDTDYLLGKTDVKQKVLIVQSRISKSLGKNIRAMREEHGLTTHYIAELLGTEESIIQQIEECKLIPNKEQIFQICDILGATPDFLNGTIVELLEAGDIDAEYRYTRQPNSLNQQKLTEGEKELLKSFRQIPHEKQQFFLQMLKAFTESIT